MGQTSVTFDWRGPEDTIHYGLTGAYDHAVTAGTPNALPFSSAGPFWEAKLTGLREGALYHYAIGSGPDHTFRTPPARGASGFTVFVEGDIGDADSYFRKDCLGKLRGNHVQQAHASDFWPTGRSGQSVSAMIAGWLVKEDEACVDSSGPGRAPMVRSGQLRDRRSSLGEQRSTRPRSHLR